MRTADTKSRTFIAMPPLDPFEHNPAAAILFGTGEAGEPHTPIDR
jgi:hypothetical protein